MIVRTDRLAGFTVVELLAAMVIGSIVVALAFSMYMFGWRLFDRWERRTELSSLVNQCEDRIAADISGSTGLYECDDSILVLEKNPLDTISYRFMAGDVVRNGVSMSTSLDRLQAEVSFSQNAKVQTGQVERLWCVRVLGKNSGFEDSAAVEFLTRVSSEEVVRSQTGGIARF